MSQMGVPIIRALGKTTKKFALHLHEFEPAAMEPLGDRYIIETLPVEETVKFGAVLVMAQTGTHGPDNDPRNPAASHAVEKRGVLPAVIIAVGNGHLLGLPDHAIPVRQMAGNDVVERYPADVPLFCEPGDVVLVDMNARGRALMIVDREIRVINQIDVLVRLPVRLQWTDEGWVRDEEERDGQDEA